MKLRQGFVSNSSTSSFIISTLLSTTFKCPCCNTKTNIVDYLNNLKELDSDIKFQVFETVDSIDMSDWYDDEMIDEVVKQVKKGAAVIEGCVPRELEMMIFKGLQHKVDFIYVSSELDP